MEVDQVIQFIAENTRRTGYPLPAPRDIAYRWARSLNLPHSGDIYLYTGSLYQLVPYINSLVGQLERIAGGRFTGLAMRIARAAARIVDFSRIVVKPDPSEIEYVENILKSIVGLLGEAGVRPAYLYEDDSYSGILLHDMGLEDLFAEHARRVYSRLKQRGVKRIVVVDPHTTYALRRLYPEYVEGFDIEVYNYLELLYKALEEGRFKPKRRLGLKAAIHDPCLYARALDIVEQPRRLLEEAGVTVVEPRRSRRYTYCCGGPVEALSPKLARKIAETRVRELEEVAKTFITMCPICYANLARVAGRDRVTDIAIVLAKAFL